MVSALLMDYKTPDARNEEEKFPIALALDTKYENRYENKYESNEIKR